MRWVRYALLSQVAATVGCKEGYLLGDTPPPPIVWEGEHVRIGTDIDPDAWCAGTFPRIDAFTGALEELFQVPESFVTSLYVFEPPITGTGVCPADWAACSYAAEHEGIAVTDRLPEDHEIVHALGSAFGNMPNFFEEGSACYWGTLGIEFPRNLDTRDVIERSWLSPHLNRGNGEYALAAHFTSYLVHTHGFERYLALFHTSKKRQSQAAFEATFEQAMGITLGRTIDDYEENSHRCRKPTDIMRSYFECSREPELLIPNREGAVLEFNISCNDPNVIGPQNDASGVPRIWRDVTIELENRFRYFVIEIPDLNEPHTVSIDVKACHTDCNIVAHGSRHLPPPEDPDLNPEGIPVQNDFSWEAEPGRYTLRISRAADDPGPVRVEIH